MASPMVAQEAPSAWPPVVVGSLFARRRSVGAQARGRVLDLGVEGPPLDSYRPDTVDSVTVIEPDPARGERRRVEAAGLGLPITVLGSLDAVDQSGRGGSFDTVVSVLGLARHADLSRALSTALVGLHTNGSLLFVEPAMACGLVAAVTTPLVALIPGLGSLHLNRDVPSAVRAHGLTIVAIERFTMPTLIWPLRPFTQATARWSLSGGDDR